MSINEGEVLGDSALYALRAQEGTLSLSRGGESGFNPRKVIKSLIINRRI